MRNKGIKKRRRIFYDFYTFGCEIWSVGAMGSYLFFIFGYGFLFDLFNLQY